MPITTVNQDSAIKVVALWQTLFGHSPPSLAYLSRQVLIYDRDPDSYFDIIYRSKVFQNEFANARGVVPEIFLIKTLHKNLGIDYPPLANMRIWAQRHDGGDLLAFIYSRPWIRQAAEHLAADFVTKIVNGEDVEYGTNLLEQPPPNEAPTGINMDNLGMISEDTAAGSTVGELQAIDPDADDTHIFTILNDDDVPFTVIGGNKIVYQGEDVSEDTDYVLQVQVEDSAGNSAGPFEVEVTVKDEDPADAIEVGSGAPGTSGDDLFVGNEETLPGSVIDGGEGEDTLKVIINLNYYNEIEHSQTELSIYDDHLGEQHIHGRYVGAFHASDIETLEVKVFGQGDYDYGVAIVDAAGMPDLEKIVIDGSQAEEGVIVTNINEADGLEIELSHSVTDGFGFDFKKGTTNGDETVTVTVDHIGAIEEQSDKHDYKEKPETKGGNLIFTEAASTPEHGKLANLEQIDLVFNGEQSAIGSITSGIVKDEYGNVVDGLETITGEGDAKVVIGYESPLIEHNKYLQTIDMSGTTADNEYIVGWGDMLWKVPVYEYDEYGHPILVDKKPLSFLGGSGDETIYLPSGLVNATINGGDGFDTAIFEYLPEGKDNTFESIELVKIWSPVGSHDPWSPDMIDMSVLNGVTNVELSCGINCYDRIETYEDGKFVMKEIQSLSDQLHYVPGFSFIDMKNLIPDTEYTLTIAADSGHDVPVAVASEEHDHEPADLGDIKYPHPIGLDSKTVVLNIDVGDKDTEPSPQAGNGTNDVFNLVLQDDVDVFLTASETEELNITADTKYGDGGHTIYFGKRDIEKTPYEDGTDEHGDTVYYYVNEEKGLDVASDLTTINLDGEADYIELAAAKPELTPNLETIDASATTGDTRLVVNKGFGSNSETGLTVTATDNDDIVYGTNNDDTLEMGAGMDYANGLGGDDVINGGDDMDNLIGGGGEDLINGGAGADWMTGGGSTATIREIVVEGKIGDGDVYTVIIEAHGEEIPVETTFSLYKFHLWMKSKWEAEDGQSMTLDQVESRLWDLDPEWKEHFKLQHLQKEIAYDINHKLYLHDLGDEMHAEVDEHGRLVVVKESGLDFELTGFAVDGHGIEDHPEMETVTIEKGHYDYGDKVVVKVKAGYGPYTQTEEFKLHIDDSLDTNDDGWVDEKEVASALADYIEHSYSSLVESAEVVGKGDTVKLTSHNKGFEISEYGTKVEDARAHISFNYVPREVTLMLDGYSAPIDLGDLSAEAFPASDEDVDVVSQIVDNLGIGYDASQTQVYTQGSTNYYVFEGNDAGGNGPIVATVAVSYHGNGQYSLEFYGPESGDPFPDTEVAATMKLVDEGSDVSGDDDVIYTPDAWLDVNDNSDPWVEHTIEDTSEGLDAGGLIQEGDPDGSDMFIVSMENPDPGVSHHNDFVEGSEESLIDTIKDFVTYYEESHNHGDPKTDVAADKIDFEGIDVDGEGFFVDASVEAGTQENPVVFSNYAEALDEAQDEFLLFALQNGGLSEGYAAASYNDGGEVATAIFVFKDDGDYLADSAVKLVGIGPGEVTEHDIVGSVPLV